MKGQFDKIFNFKSVSPKRLIIPLAMFQLFFKNLFKNSRLLPVSTTPVMDNICKLAAGFIDTGATLTRGVVDTEINFFLKDIDIIIWV